MQIIGGAPKATGDAGAAIKDATTATFQADVLDASRSALVLVDFWADWCGPCKQLTPVLEKVVNSFNGTVRLVKVDVDKNQTLAAQLRVQSLPTVYAFKDGGLIDGFMGAQPESGIREFIARCGAVDAAGASIEEALQVAQTALETGDLQQAAEIFASILSEDQHNVAALAGLANCYLKSGDHQRAAQTLSLVPPDKQSDMAVASVRSAIELAEAASSAGPVTEFEAKLKANPDDHQARMDLAMAAVAAGQKTQAVDQLLEIFRRDRTWNDEAARKQLLKLFEAWGPKDNDTIDGRRKLSSLMFS
ncbi:MAG: thioredoxin [Pseudomonadota bacterium]